MSIHGYKTNAVCLLTIVGRSTKEPLRANLIDMLTDGAQIISDAPLPVGTMVAVTLEGFQMPSLNAQVVGNGGNDGTGYRLEIKLKGSWPYQVFTALAASAMSGGKRSNGTPECLRVLELSQPCSVAMVEQAFWSKVRTAHPDRGGSVEAFVRIRGAYCQALELLGAGRKKMQRA